MNEREKELQFFQDLRVEYWKNNGIIYKQFPLRPPGRDYFFIERIMFEMDFLVQSLIKKHYVNILKECKKCHNPYETKYLDGKCNFTELEMQFMALLAHKYHIDIFRDMRIKIAHDNRICKYCGYEDKLYLEEDEKLPTRAKI
jgi:hypothetical protein